MKSPKIENLTVRQQKILAAIIKEYSESANPVGSKELEDKYNLKCSSATIRNEMAELEKSGYIFQPHKSAGRVPTDFGYRFFINQLMHRFELSEKERKLLRDELFKLKSAHEQLGRSITNLISQISGQAAFMLMPHEANATGLSKIIGEPELSDPDATKAVAQLLEHMEDHSTELFKQKNDKAEIYVGGESPLPVPKNLSLVVSKVNLKDGKKGVVGILGPKRMSYAKNLSILEYLSKIISGGAMVMLIINI